MSEHFGPDGHGEERFEKRPDRSGPVVGEDGTVLGYRMRFPHIQWSQSYLWIGIPASVAGIALAAALGIQP